MVVVTVMSMLMVVAVAVTVAVGTPVMSSVGVIVQNLHNDEVADQSEDASQKHDERFVDYLLVDHPGGSLYEEFNCDNVDDGNIDECSQRLCLLPAEGEVFGRVGPGAKPDCPERNEVGQHIRKQMESISKDGDRVSKVTSNKFDGHEEQGHPGYLNQLLGNFLVLSIHRN